MKDETILAELKRIADDHGGVLRACDVVEEARRVVSPLHSRFEWDDSAAAEKWRIEQAGQLIRVSVQYLQINGETTSVRAFVSLRSDRAEDGGGYRQTVSVLSDDAYREQLLDDALAELKAFQQKYSHLKELARVFSAAKKVKGSRRSDLVTA